MEERKRRISPVRDANEGNAAQRRKLSNAAGSQASTTEDASSGGQLDAALGLEDGFLETFRKGALHRQMLEYKREWERISTKAEQVEQQWSTSNAKLTEIEACWSRLVDELRSVVGDEKVDTDMANGHIDEENSDPQISDRIKETSRLIAALAKKATSSTSSDLLQRQDSLSRELISSQSVVKHLERVLEETREELDQTLAALRTTQKQVDRHQSLSVRKLDKSADNQTDTTKSEKGQGLLKPTSALPSAAASPAAAATSTSPGGESPVKHEVKEEAEQNELRDVLEGSSGLTRSEIERLQQEAELRQKEAETLRQEKAQLLTEFDTFKVNYVEIREEKVASTFVYKALEEKLKAAEASANEATEEMKTLRDQLVVLRSERDKFRTDLEAEFTKANQKLQQDITRLQQDLTRVRAERDSHSAEIAECKAREQEKYRHVQEMKTLASSRQARIDTLVSEVYRLRMKVAAQDGDADLVQQYADAQALLQKEINGSAVKDTGNGASDASDLPEEMVVRSLQSRVKELEALSTTYKKHLQSFSEASDEDIDMAEELLRGEAQAKADLEEAQKKITKLEEMLQTTDTANLSKRASEAEATVAKLEAKVKAHDLSTNMLISEVSRLSETWEQLNKQNQSKVLDVAQYDLRLERLANEKAKANQKYFASEREKEALTTQVTLYTRLSTNQKGVIEKLEWEQRALSEKSLNAEKELAERIKAEQMLEEMIKKVQQELTDLQTKWTSLRQQFENQRKLFDERTAALSKEESARQNAEDQVAKLEKELEKWKAKATQATAAANGQGRYVETDVKGMAEENTLLKRMLKCSSCRQKFKSHTITRCFHMFCKDCIDSRLETRQRKCPSCSAAFGAHDVQQVYF